MDINIKPLSAELIDDFMDFFDHKAFCDNPEWAGCYCYYHQYEKSLDEWCKRTSEDNRSAAVESIKSGKMKGCMAYVDNMPVGWCNANRKTEFNLLVKGVKAQENERNICSIVCFIVAPEHRRKGIASMMLDFICTQSQKQGFDAIEAYPAKNVQGDAHNYHGPLQMYLSAGFSVVGATEEFDVVRKDISRDQFKCLNWGR